MDEKAAETTIQSQSTLPEASPGGATEIEKSFAVEKLTDSIRSFSQGEIVQGSSQLINEFVVPAVGGLLALLAAYFLAKLVSRQVRIWVCQRVDETLGRFISKIAFYSLILLAITIILPTVGVQVSGLMAILATAGFAIGLAFQGTLSNFSAGILLLVFRPFKVGDMVNIAGLTGKVNEVDLFTTTLDTPDNRRMILPNSSIAGNVIENMTFHDHRRVEVTVGVEYSASLDRTREALTACAESMADCTIPGENRGHQVLLSNLGESSVQWTVRVWVAKDQFLECRERLTSQIKRYLDQAGIGIPFPQLRVHLASRASGEQKNRHHSALLGQVSAPAPSLSIPDIHPPESRRSRIRPRVRGESQE